MKAGSSRLIPKKLSENLKLIFVEYTNKHIDEKLTCKRQKITI